MIRKFMMQAQPMNIGTWSSDAMTRRNIAIGSLTVAALAAAVLMWSLPFGGGAELYPRHRIVGSQESLASEEIALGSGGVGRIRAIDENQGKYVLEWKHAGQEEWNTAGYDRPDRVTATVIASVGLTYSGQYKYSYEIRVAGGQHLSGFFLQTFSELTQPITQPGAYVGEMSTDIEQFSEGRWISFRTPIEPGTTAFFEIESDDPPRIVQCRIRGGELVLRSSAGEVPGELDDRRLSYESWPMGLTIGPSGNPNLQTREGRLAYAAEELDRLKQLGWMAPDLVEEYHSAIAHDQEEKGSSVEDRVREDLKAGRVTTEFFALMSHLPVSAPNVSLERYFADELRSGGRGPEMIWIPPGRFRMGCAFVAGCDARGIAAHKVEFGVPFGLSKHEITRRQFADFVQSAGYATNGGSDEECRMWSDGWERDPYRTWKNPGFSQTDSHPVVCVSWEDAVAYTHWLSDETGKLYRLPSDAEWEYAARAGSLENFRYENDQWELCKAGNVADRTVQQRYSSWSIAADCFDNYVHTAPVGQFRANEIGLFDMQGNVREWVQDCRNANYENMPSDGSAWVQGDCRVRAQRGFSWAEGPQAYFPDVRFSNRHTFIPTFRSIYAGFRVAVDKREQ